MEGHADDQEVVPPGKNECRQAGARSSEVVETKWRGTLLHARTDDTEVVPPKTMGCGRDGTRPSNYLSRTSLTFPARDSGVNGF